MSIFKGFKSKLEKKRESMKAQIQRGRMVTEQMRADKLRKKRRKVLDGKPGAVNTMRRHLLMQTRNPLDVMRDEWSRRKNERNKEKD